MITSDKQLSASKLQLTSLDADVKSDVPKIINEANSLQLQELIQEIKAEIEEYEALKSSKIEDLKTHSINDLMSIPIRYRIAKHMSVDTFSRKVGISARQIHRYEAEEYSNTNTSTLKKILGNLDVSLDGHIAP